MMDKLQELAIFCQRLHEQHETILTLLEQGSAPVFRGVCAMNDRRMELEQRAKKLAESFELNRPARCVGKEKP